VDGVYLAMRPARAGVAGCGSARDAADAEAVARMLGIPFTVLDAGEEFERIVGYFAEEYARGRTPNPCIRCNAVIKFGRLWRHASECGAEAVATGHYARVAEADGRPAILRGRAADKDQSYALFALPAERLGRVRLPIGELPDKEAVRAEARRRGLPVYDKPDSQDVCFVAGDHYAEVLRDRAPESLRSGDIVNADGEVLGRHDGFGRFTIGQRRGLGVAAGEPMYVTRIEPATGRVVIGPRGEAAGRRLEARDANWHADAPTRFRATVQVRYNHRGAPAEVTRTEAGFAAEFDEPVHAITPGQAAVVYDDERLLGGGWIASTE
jgi:tRNA-specific 2-thiouridylase